MEAHRTVMKHINNVKTKARPLRHVTQELIFLKVKIKEKLINSSSLIERILIHSLPMLF
jgi:hypothetical protein